MRRFLLAATCLLVASVIAPAALADEVIHFTNGTTMAIRSHEIKGDMIEINLGRGAVMAFPSYMVERIEAAGRDVYVAEGYTPRNQAVAGDPSAAPAPSGPMQQPGLAAASSRFRRGEDETPLTSAARAQAYQLGLGKSAEAPAASGGRARALDVKIRANRGHSATPRLVGTDGSEYSPPRIDTGRTEDALRGARIQPRTTGVGQPAPPLPPPTETEGTTDDGGDS